MAQIRERTHAAEFATLLHSEEGSDAQRRDYDKHQKVKLLTSRTEREPTLGDAATKGHLVIRTTDRQSKSCREYSNTQIDQRIH